MSLEIDRLEAENGRLYGLLDSREAENAKLRAELAAMPPRCGVYRTEDGTVRVLEHVDFDIGIGVLVRYTEGNLLWTCSPDSFRTWVAATGAVRVDDENGGE